MSQIVVVRVIDEFSVVLNIGSDEGITEGDNFLVYYIAPDEILDPVTGEKIAVANEELTEENLKNLMSNQIDGFDILYTNEFDRGPYISDTLKLIQTQTLKTLLADKLQRAPPSTEKQSLEEHRDLVLHTAYHWKPMAIQWVRDRCYMVSFVGNQ
jgi:hypothetical protein